MLIKHRFGKNYTPGTLNTTYSSSSKEGEERKEDEMWIYYIHYFGYI